jgi:hypothetical protein
MDNNYLDDDDSEEIIDDTDDFEGNLVFFFSIFQEIKLFLIVTKLITYLAIHLYLFHPMNQIQHLKATMTLIW